MDAQLIEKARTLRRRKHGRIAVYGLVWSNAWGLAVCKLPLYSSLQYLPQVYELGYLFNFFKSMPESKLSEAVAGLDELIVAIREDIAVDTACIVLQDELATCLLLKVRFIDSYTSRPMGCSFRGRLAKFLNVTRIYTKRDYIIVNGIRMSRLADACIYDSLRCSVRNGSR